jgi:hypothetical protein
MRMKITLIALAVLVLIGGGYYWYANDMSFERVEIEEGEEMEENNMPSSQGKLDINAVCEGALAYMTFPDGESAEVFVKECKEGEHPEVIERYKADMNLGAGATI